MMAYVRLRIDKYLEGQHMTGGALVEVRRLDVGPRAAAGVTRTTVPMGRSSVERRLDLAPGSYEFTAILPSGDVLSRVAEVDARPDGVAVVFDGGRSAHEWMSWQHALGNVVGAETLFTLRGRSPRPTWAGVAGVLADWIAVPTSPRGPDQVIVEVAAHLATGAGGGRPLFKLPAVPRRLPSNDDPPFKVFRMPPAGGFDYQQPSFVRHYLRVIDSAGREMLCVLPYPWRNAEGSEVLVEALVGPDQPLDADADVEQADVPWSVSTIARDEHVASVLSYFAAGDGAAAAFLASTALDLLFGKMINPLAASAGAYVLMDQWLGGGPSATRAEPWFGWIDNLTSWFPWLPDGAVLRGWLALAGRAGPHSVAVARSAFLEAERRGIPVYTAGVRRLADGLSRIASQDRLDKREDQAVLVALDRVRRLAWNADPRYPFTTIRLWVETS